MTLGNRLVPVLLLTCIVMFGAAPFVYWSVNMWPQIHIYEPKITY